jgi:hypothetical protein
MILSASRAAAQNDGLPSRHLLVVQPMRRIPGSDDRRQAELAADDRGVGRAATVIGYDRRSALHDGNPVRIGRLRDQDRSIDEAADLARTLDQARHT